MQWLCWRQIAWLSWLMVSINWVAAKIITSFMLPNSLSIWKTICIPCSMILRMALVSRWIKCLSVSMNRITHWIRCCIAVWVREIMSWWSRLSGNIVPVHFLLNSLITGVKRLVFILCLRGAFWRHILPRTSWLLVFRNDWWNKWSMHDFLRNH